MVRLPNRTIGINLEHNVSASDTPVAPRNQRQMRLWHLAGLRLEMCHVFYTLVASLRL